MKIGLPSSAMISLEWWSFEIQAILASYISVVAVGSMVIMINALTVLTMIPFGSQIAGAVFVGKSMGEGSAKRAKTYMKLIVGYTFIVMAVLAVFLYFFRMNVSLIFTDQEVLLNLTSDNFRFIALFMIVHGIGMSIGGALRGMGK